MKFWLLVLSPVAENPNKVKKLREIKANLEYKIATQQSDMVEAHIRHWNFNAPERRGGVYCTSPREVMFYQRKFQERVTACQRVSLSFITFHPTVKSSIFLEGWGFFSFSFLRTNFIGHTLLGGKETKLFGIKASCGSLPTEENCFGHRFVLTIP